MRRIRTGLVVGVLLAFCVPVLGALAWFAVRDIGQEDRTGAAVLIVVFVLPLSYVLGLGIRRVILMMGGPKLSVNAAAATPASTPSVPETCYSRRLDIRVGTGETEVEVPANNLLLVGHVRALLDGRGVPYRIVSFPLPAGIRMTLDQGRTLFMISSLDQDLLRALQELDSSM